MTVSGTQPDGPFGGDDVETGAGSAAPGLTAASERDRTPGTAEGESGREWRPGDPVYADVPERGHCLNAACGATWSPSGASTCPDCGSLAGAACVLDESNDMEAFAALPGCVLCSGIGKQVPPGFWGGESVTADDAIERVARALAIHDGHRWSSPEGKPEGRDRRRAIASREYYLVLARAAVQALRDGGAA